MESTHPTPRRPLPWTWAIVSALGLAIATASGAAAQSTPYGAASDRHYAIGQRAEETLDFDTAIINYRRALNLAQQFRDPVLRACGVAGAEARIRSAETQKRSLQGRSPSARTINEARSAGQDAFSRYWDEFDARNPNLVGRCP